MKIKFTALITAFCAFFLAAQTQAFSGLLTGKTKLDPIMLVSGKPLAKAPYKLKAGKYYSLDFVSDGSAELAITGPEFFRNVWVNEVVINDIEVRPLGLDSLEFDDEGTATISFVTIRPGTFTICIAGTECKEDSTQTAVIVVE